MSRPYSTNLLSSLIFSIFHQPECTGYLLDITVIIWQVSPQLNYSDTHQIWMWFKESNGYFHKSHDDVIKWKHFPRYWPFVRRIHWSPVYSPHKGQWRGALMFSLICVLINGWVNNREAGDLRRYCAHYDVIVMSISLAGKLTNGALVTHTHGPFY